MKQKEKGARKAGSRGGGPQEARSPPRFPLPGEAACFNATKPASGEVFRPETDKGRVLLAFQANSGRPCALFGHPATTAAVFRRCRNLRRHPIWSDQQQNGKQFDGTA